MWKLIHTLLTSFLERVILNFNTSSAKLSANLQETSILREQNRELLKLLNESLNMSNTLVAELIRDRRGLDTGGAGNNPGADQSNSKSPDLDSMTHSEIVDYYADFYTGSELVAKLQEVYRKRVERQNEKVAAHSQVINSLESLERLEAEIGIANS